MNKFLNFANINGTQIEYYFFCKRQLWLFSHQLNREQESDIVKMGKVIHEESYERERKEIRIGEHLVLDFADVQAKVIHEVKKSNKMEKAHEWQLKYYLYCLREFGIDDFQGELNYPKLRKTVNVELTEADIQKLEEVIIDIGRINAGPTPEAVKKKPCLKCAYYEYCFC
ncbi:MAG TPA: CRISPR-associated protein Cas4 [Candidatus Marinimicrobia bacterium]|nr:CRISPR-associated protein Cas4 [Candidatus Neomarinimicrobiota bacterium]